jgi:hypothetical protein
MRAADRRAFLDQLQEWNSTYGYYGAPPVPDNQVLQYFFDEDPRRAWVIVEVGKKRRNGTLRATDIPFWNRATGADATRFRQLCTQGIGRLRNRQSGVPPSP